MSEEYEQPSEEYTEEEHGEEHSPAEIQQEEATPSYAEKKFDPIIIVDKTKQEDDKEDILDKMIIRSYSSMILFIPSFIAALVIGITQILLNRYKGIPLDEATVGAGYMDIMGIIFLVIFSLNLILIAFDFNRARTIIIIVTIIAVIAILLLVNAYTGFMSGGVPSDIRPMRIYFSSQVYIAIAILLFLILTFTFLGSLFNYYLVIGNELLHKKGIGGGVERYPAANMSVVKEYPDILEYVLFRSGTLILTPPRATRSIILRNVIGINKKEKDMNEILSRLKVDID